MAGDEQSVVQFNLNYINLMKNKRSKKVFMQTLNDEKKIILHKLDEKIITKLIAKKNY